MSKKICWIVFDAWDVQRRLKQNRLNMEDENGSEKDQDGTDGHPEL